MISKTTKIIWVSDKGDKEFNNLNHAEKYEREMDLCESLADVNTGCVNFYVGAQQKKIEVPELSVITFLDFYEDNILEYYGAKKDD